MKSSANAIDLIKKFEGFCATPYFCPAAKLSIGYGHVVIKGEKFPPLGITREEGEALLKQDVIIAELAIERLVVYELSQNQFDALVSFIYNVGVKAFEKSKLLRILNSGEELLAAAEFSRWVYAGKIVQKGLVRRRDAEKTLFLTRNL